jgi:hypothetical protein
VSVLPFRSHRLSTGLSGKFLAFFISFFISLFLYFFISSLLFIFLSFFLSFFLFSSIFGQQTFLISMISASFVFVFVIFACTVITGTGTSERFLPLPYFLAGCR